MIIDLLEDSRSPKNSGLIERGIYQLMADFSSVDQNDALLGDGIRPFDVFLRLRKDGSFESEDKLAKGEDTKLPQELLLKKIYPLMKKIAELDAPKEDSCGK